ncbi:MAG: hypothetical protein Ct9H300mP25_15170 [Acidobacteriota bacterium]|nr:MAG: hypothetical protein Ct9H300mP25_15170 [Acidobacteriota bacterium]
MVEAIPDETIQSLADPYDLDRDGISGRAPIVVDLVTGDERVGRFLGGSLRWRRYLNLVRTRIEMRWALTNDLFSPKN